ncbi:hypothetical protein K438DRAFT_189933 [Mycena galopus ATCC 62051]|nr:hypothetical protein K438DRAFT_189933 [Mycena galopus ATCC 62051]
MSPTHRSYSPDTGLPTRWMRQMGGASYHRGSRSESPHREVTEERMLRRSRSPMPRDRLSSRGSRTRRSPSLTEHSLEVRNHCSLYNSSRGTGVGTNLYATSDCASQFPSRAEAVLEIKNWAEKYTEFKAPAPLEGLEAVNVEWLHAAILVCDVRSMARMRAWAAVCPITDIAVILMMALVCGVPYKLYVNEAQVDSIGVTPIFSALMQKTLEALYSPGSSETYLVYGSGGGDLYARYSSQILGLLSRPHAVAFLNLGGVCSFIAQLYNKELVTRFLEGPIVQVREYHKGKSFWLPGAGGSFVLDYEPGIGG